MMTLKDRTTAARPRRSGFTLVELIVVMLIVTVLAGVAVPVASKIYDREARDATKAEMQSVDVAVRMYFLDTGSMPANPAALLTDPGSVTGWSGPYLSGGVGGQGGGTTDFDSDGWQEAYQVAMVGDTWTMTSGGPDRSQGTSDDIALTVDITLERRRITDERLAVINLAIRLYNDDWLSPPSPQSPDPLNDSWAVARMQLISRGYLSNAAEYATDGWGSDFVRTGTSGPVVEVTSVNTGS